MFCYGAAAQQYLKQTDLATDGLEELLGVNTIAGYRTSADKRENHSNSPLPSLGSVKNVTNTNDTDLITWKSATLVFDTTITMRLRFTTTEANFAALNGSDATFDVSFGYDITLSNAVQDIKAAPDPTDDTKETLCQQSGLIVNN